MITHNELVSALSYNKRTGFFKNRVTRPKSPRNTILGYLHKHGYVQLYFAGKMWKAHRLAWFYVTGKFPTFDIEHKNLKKADNRWSNLRPTNDTLNQANTRKRPNNSGYKGVHQRGGGTYRARISVANRRIHLGTYSSPELAHAAYVAAAKRHFGEFARAH